MFGVSKVRLKSLAQKACEHDDNLEYIDIDASLESVVYGRLMVHLAMNRKLLPPISVMTDYLQDNDDDTVIQFLLEAVDVMRKQ